jgi:hypothetical protein
VRNQRKKIWIDSFQTRISVRLALYFVLYQAAVWCLFWMDSRFADLSRSEGLNSFTFGYFITPAAAFALGLVFIFDALRETHRIVGPLYRFRKTVQAVTAGGEVRQVVLRKTDHLQDFNVAMNEMLHELEKRGAICLVESTTAKSQEPAVA